MIFDTYPSRLLLGAALVQPEGEGSLGRFLVLLLGDDLLAGDDLGVVEALLNPEYDINYVNIDN